MESPRRDGRVDARRSERGATLPGATRARCCQPDPRRRGGSAARSAGALVAGVTVYGISQPAVAAWGARLGVRRRGRAPSGSSGRSTTARSSTASTVRSWPGRLRDRRERVANRMPAAPAGRSPPRRPGAAGADRSIAVRNTPRRRCRRPRRGHEPRPARTPVLVLDGTLLARAAEDLDDPSPIYRGSEAIAHPGLLLRQANLLAENVALGPWIHVSSDVAHCGLARAGDCLEIRRVARVTSATGAGGWSSPS